MAIEKIDYEKCTSCGKRGRLGDASPSGPLELRFESGPFLLEAKSGRANLRSFVLDEILAVLPKVDKTDAQK